MTTIYLIRHGQKHKHSGDPALTRVGIIQAQQTGKYLSQFPISKIISSPFKRTVQTANNIALELGLDVELNDDLVERMNWKEQSVTRNEFLKEWNKATKDRRYIPKHGSSSWFAGERVASVVKKVVSHDDEHIVLVTHGGAILDYLRNVFSDEKIAKLKKQYETGEDYQMCNCAINKLVLDDEISLKLLNFVEHLSEVTE